jgi:sensor c-di-GMP phosphodiesterase-like protein
MSTSSYVPCSSAELTYFRALIFNAKYLKDAGRMSAGKIDCSASLGRPEHPMAPAKPDFTVKGETNVYASLALYMSEDQSAITLEHDGFDVVLIPYIQAHTGLEPEHFSESVRDAVTGQVSWLLGDLPAVSATALASDGSYHMGNSLYATRCSRVFANCVTAYTSIPEALQADYTQSSIYMILGGATGAGFGFLCSFLYRRNQSMEQQLRRAIRKDKLYMAYQPIVALDGGRRIVGAEALARWIDEDGFAIGPDVFIKVAEKHGFIGEITKLVLRHVLNDFGELLRAHPGFHVSVNVAAADLSDPEFLPMLKESLERANIPAQSVAIEITESSTAAHKTAEEAIRQLHERGHSVHIDDFGTGYSSLSYLHDLSVDAIKIDRSFTQTIGTESVTVGILPQIMAMANTLNLRVIVEGVETQEQASYFANSDESVLGQGWLFGRPLAPEAFQRLLAEDEKNAQVAAG